MRILLLAATLIVGALSDHAHGQTLRDALLMSATAAPDLELPTDPSYLGLLSTPKMALYRPEGAGPFPAMVLHHACAGLQSSSGTWQNMAVLEWAKQAVRRGYVALVLDSLGPRSVDSVCMGAKGGVNFARGVRDALQAAQHLRTLPYVDGKRVVFTGFSWGAMVGLLSSSKSWGEALAAGDRFRAVAAFYPGCFEIRPPRSRPFQVLNPDIDVPLLVLMGDLDTETPAQECIARLGPIKAGGGPVEWHVYADATHAWDSENLSGLRKVDFRGAAVEYKFNPEASRDSAERMFGFFARILDSKP